MNFASSSSSSSPPLLLLCDLLLLLLCSSSSSVGASFLTCFLLHLFSPVKNLSIHPHALTHTYLTFTCWSRRMTMSPSGILPTTSSWSSSSSFRASFLFSPLRTGVKSLVFTQNFCFYKWTLNPYISSSSSPTLPLLLLLPSSPPPLRPPPPPPPPPLLIFLFGRCFLPSFLRSFSPSSVPSNLA